MYFFCMRIAVKTLAYYKSIKLFSSVNNGFHIFGCLHQTRMGIKAYSTWNSAFHRLHDTHTHTHMYYTYTQSRVMWGMTGVELKRSCWSSLLGVVFPVRWTDVWNCCKGWMWDLQVRSVLHCVVCSWRWCHSVAFVRRDFLHCECTAACDGTGKKNKSVQKPIAFCSINSPYIKIAVSGGVTWQDLRRGNTRAGHSFLHTHNFLGPI